MIYLVPWRCSNKGKYRRGEARRGLDLWHGSDDVWLRRKGAAVAMCGLDPWLSGHSIVRRGSGMLRKM
jgi:hypothetical protein